MPIDTPDDWNAAARLLRLGLTGEPLDSASFLRGYRCGFLVGYEAGQLDMLAHKSSSWEAYQRDAAACGDLNVSRPPTPTPPPVPLPAPPQTTGPPSPVETLAPMPARSGTDDPSRDT